MSVAFNLDSHIAKIPDFPKPGILFYDISPALEDADVLKQMIAALTEIALPLRPDIIAGIDARGFLFAMPLALSLNCGTVMIRKSGKLPGKVFEESYELEYGKARLAIQASRTIAGKRVLLVDDLLATGGTLAASASLIKQAGGIVAGAACLIELTGLKGRAKLAEVGCDVVCLQSYEF
ncbi:MAG: adenine phosphoribosyltransferase [Candidatus Puniceispirillaceae bacterium]